jgi:hypothetical protein
MQGLRFSRRWLCRMPYVLVVTYPYWINPVSNPNPHRILVTPQRRPTWRTGLNSVWTSCGRLWRRCWTWYKIKSCMWGIREDLFIRLVTSGCVWLICHWERERNGQRKLSLCLTDEALLSGDMTTDTSTFSRAGHWPPEVSGQLDATGALSYGVLQIGGRADPKIRSGRRWKDKIMIAPVLVLQPLGFPVRSHSLHRLRHISSRKSERVAYVHVFGIMTAPATFKMPFKYVLLSPMVS